MKALVAIVGRPNVGKSTLFNRLARRRLALVENVPGVTRDRHYAETDWHGREFTLIDTGGFLPEEQDSLLAAVRQQAQLAVEESDVILFVVDGRAGLTAADEQVAGFLRKSKKPVVLAVNKIDTPKHETTTYFTEFYRLGLEDTVSVSAEHGRGIDELMERALRHLPQPEPKPEGFLVEGDEQLDADEADAEDAEEGVVDGDDAALDDAEAGEEGDEEEGEKAPEKPPEPLRLAIVGRPNVGKSTLVNALLGRERLVASPVPGTTTDPIDSVVEHKGQQIILTDTAGIRRKKNIAQKIEQYSIVASLRTIERSQVAVLLIDATEPAVDQDERIAGIAEEKGRALVIVVNKWDLVARKPGDEEEGREWIKQRFRFASYAPVIFASAKTGARVGKVLDAAVELYAQYTFRARTPQLNRLLSSIQESHPAPMSKGRRIRLYYIAQVGTEPPAFVLNTSQPENVPDDYKRYLVNEIRNAFGLRVPIRLFFRERPGQAKRAARKNNKLIEQRRHKRRREE